MPNVRKMIAQRMYVRAYLRPAVENQRMVLLHKVTGAECACMYMFDDSNSHTERRCIARKVEIKMTVGLLAVSHCCGHILIGE